MKVFFAECSPLYESYTFPVSVFAVTDGTAGDAEAALAAGFLPFTGNWELGAQFPHQLHYLARSVRVNLSEFRVSSENRRVLRKAERFRLLSVVPLADCRALVESDAFLDFCCAYADRRFKGGSMSRRRLAFVLSRTSATHLFTFVDGSANNDRVVAYVVANHCGSSLHFWFSFFDCDDLASNLGIYAMLSVILWCKERSLKHIYLGTGYGAKALYKIRNFAAIEWFDANAWSCDVAELKRRISLDGEALAAGDHFKADQLGQAAFVEKLLARQ